MKGRRKKTTATLSDRQAAYIADLPVSYQDGMRKALIDKSLAYAVKMKCRDCCGFENATERVRDCNITTCPLWAVRR